MRVRDLVFAAETILRARRDPLLEQFFSNLRSGLQEQKKQPQRDVAWLLALLESGEDHLSDFKIEDYGSSVQAALRALGSPSLLGSKVYEEFVGIVEDSKTNPKAASDKLQKRISKFDQDLRNIEQIFQLLSGLPTITLPRETDEGKSLFRIFFKERASISTFQDMEEHGESWHQTLWFLARLTGTSSAEEAVEAVDEGSIVLYITCAIGVATALAKTTNLVLEAVERLARIRKTRLEAEQLQLENRKIVAGLEAEEARLLKEKPASITQSLALEYSLDELEDGNTVRNGMEKVIGKLISFFDRGGEIEFIQISAPEEDAVKRINKQSATLRRLEAEVVKLKFLSAGEPVGSSSGPNEESPS
ncbi:MAG: hypothetical protein GY719_40650 [bacterium]|nr:hypothetical protein [bacterium]